MGSLQGIPAEGPLDGVPRHVLVDARADMDRFESDV
jgi:hypothetical protein